MPATNYTKALGDELVKRLSAGEALADICRDDHMPAVRTVSDWRAAHPAFDVAFLQARDIGFDAIANRTRATARGKKADDGGDSTGDVARDRLIIENDHKLLSKWDPRRYGDRIQHEHSGQIAQQTDEALDARINELMGKASAAPAPAPAKKTAKKPAAKGKAK
ncbi:hypothetical protein ACI2IY_05715 [Lysobacter enzymogenes]|uniref:terminase small subunit-like protein n=1 Tax=Lysobacter enzymogenes TaxID=69 RepID=UPI0038516588